MPGNTWRIMLVLAAAAAAGSTARAADLWVDAAAAAGGDGRPGTPFNTLQAAASAAVRGDVVLIRPGRYRETITPANSGLETAPILYQSQLGKDQVLILGSISSSALAWSPYANVPPNLFPAGVGAHIWVADLTGYESPEIVVSLSNAAGTLAEKWPKAREPDWTPTTPWKVHETWWNADAGNSLSVSSSLLASINGFSGPDLTGGTVFCTDSYADHYTYRRRIVSQAGTTLTLDRPCSNEGATFEPGPYSKFFVENRPELLDQEREWYFDEASRRLYLWPAGDADPATLPLEITVRTRGLNLRNRSHLIFRNLNFQYFNNGLVASLPSQQDIVNFNNYQADQSVDVTFEGVRLYVGGTGMTISQAVDPAQPRYSSRIVLRDCEIAEMEGEALVTMFYYAGYAATDYNHDPPPGLSYLYITDSRFHHLALRSSMDEQRGLRFVRPFNYVFARNHVHDVGLNGVLFQYAKYGIVSDNFFEDCVLNGSDAGNLKFHCGDPDISMHSNLVANNVSRNCHGWSYADATHYQRWYVSRGIGQGGDGIYFDYCASANNSPTAVVYRNVAYDNSRAGLHIGASRGVWAYNNTLAHNSYNLMSTGDSPTFPEVGFGSEYVNNLIYTRNVGHPDSDLAQDRGIYLMMDPAHFDRLTLRSNLFKSVAQPSAVAHGNLVDLFFKDRYSFPVVFGWYPTVADFPYDPWKAGSADWAPGERIFADEEGRDFTLKKGGRACDAGDTAAVAKIHSFIRFLEARLGFAVAYPGRETGDGYDGRIDLGARELIPVQPPRNLRRR